MLAPSLAWLRPRRLGSVPEVGAGSARALSSPRHTRLVELIVRSSDPRLGGTVDRNGDRQIPALVSDAPGAGGVLRGRAQHLPRGTRGHTWFLDASAANSTQPSLFVWGRRDPVVPIGFERHVREALPAHRTSSSIADTCRSSSVREKRTRRPCVSYPTLRSVGNSEQLVRLVDHGEPVAQAGQAEQTLHLLAASHHGKASARFDRVLMRPDNDAQSGRVHEHEFAEVQDHQRGAGLARTSWSSSLSDGLEAKSSSPLTATTTASPVLPCTSI